MRYPTFVSMVIYLDSATVHPESVVSRLAGVLRRHFEMAELVVVDNGLLPHETSAVRETLEGLDMPSTVVRFARPHGMEAAMMAGLERAIGDFIFEIDSPELPNPDEVLPDLYRRSAGGVDIVVAAEEGSRLSSRLFYRLLNRTSGLDVRLGSERVRVVSRRALNAMLVLPERVRYRKILYAITGYPRAIVTYPGPPPRRRRLGREDVRLAVDILLSFSSTAAVATYLLSLFFAVFSLAAVGWTVGNYLLRDRVPEGWATVMLMLSVGFTGVFMMLGILAAYFIRVLAELRGRPLYAIQEVRTVMPLPPDLRETKG